MTWADWAIASTSPDSGLASITPHSGVVVATVGGSPCARELRGGEEAAVGKIGVLAGGVHDTANFRFQGLTNIVEEVGQCRVVGLLLDTQGMVIAEGDEVLVDWGHGTTSWTPLEWALGIIRARAEEIK